MPRACFICLLAVVLSGAAGFSEARAAGIPVRGFLVSNGEKVAGATVRLASAPSQEQRFEMGFAHLELEELARARSEKDGYFELAAPEMGFYQLQVEAAGFLGTDRWVAAIGAVPDPVTIELIRARPVRLTVKDPEGRPVAGARARLGFDKDGAGRYPTWPLFRSTSLDGGVVLPVPVGQEAVAVLAAPGFAAAVVRLPVDKDSLETRLDPGLPLDIEVVDPRRRFLPGVAIFVPDSLQEIGRTGRDGRARVRIAADQQLLGFSDAEGRYALEAVPVAARGAARPVEPAAAEPSLRVTLEDRPPVEGQVFELPERVPLANAWVSFWGMPPVFTRTDRLGRFQLPRVPGRRHLQAVKQGYCPAGAEVGALPLQIGIALEPAATLFGQVTDAAGEPVAGALVVATVDSHTRSLHWGGRARATTDREGRYSIGDLPAGEEAVVEASHQQLHARITIEPVAAGEEVRVDLRLPRRETWSCRAFDPQDKPIAGAEVFVSSSVLAGARLPSLGVGSRPERGGQVRRLGLTDAEGNFATFDLPAGGHHIGVRAAAFAAEWRAVQVVTRGETSDLAGEAGADEAIEPETFVLRPLLGAAGKVLDENGSGLPDATVHLVEDNAPPPGPETPPLVTTGDGGEFSFTAFPAGASFQLIAGKEGYVSVQGSGIMPDTGEEPPPLELRLVPAGLVEGKVTGDGKEIAFARLVLEPLDLPPRLEYILWKRQTRSDAEGGYLLDRLWPGRYRLAVESGGFQRWRSDVFEVAAGERKRLDVELLAAGLVFGKVLLRNGEPVPDAWVSLAEREDGPTAGTARMPTDALGQYRIDTAPPGGGWLQAQTGRYGSHGRAVEIGPGVNEIDFVLETGSLEIAGRVVDDDGEPVAGALVRLQGDQIHREERTGSEGEVSFTELDPGSYRLEPAARGYLGEAVPIELESSLEGQTWRLRAARARISGILYGLDSSSLPRVRILVRAPGKDGGVQVAVHGGHDSGPGVAPDGQGRFTVQGLAAGTWLLVASLPGPSRILTRQIEISEGEEEIELDLDFGSLAGPWTGRVLLAGVPQKEYFFVLSHSELGQLLYGTESDDLLELQAEAGTYKLEIFSEGAAPKELHIEIGAPFEQPVELGEPPGANTGPGREKGKTVLRK